MQRASLRQNVSWTFIGNVVYAAGQMLVFVLMAKLLDAERVGMYALGLAITTPIFILFFFGLRQVLATDARNLSPFSHYFSLRLLMAVSALVVSAAVLVIGGYGGSTAAVIGTIALSKAVEAISDVFYGLFQRQERLELMARSMIARSVLMVPAFVVGVQLTDTVEWGVMGIVVAWLAVLLGYDYPQARRMLGHIQSTEASNSLEKGRLLNFSRKPLLALGRLAFPLAIATVLVSLQFQIPRYLIEHIQGVALLGIYAGMAYPMFALRTLVLALCQSAAPRLARLHAEGKTSDFRRTLLKLSAIGLLGGLLMIALIALAGEELILFLYKPEFAEHLDAFIWIAVAGAINFMLSYSGYGMTVLRIFKLQPALTTLAIILITSLCLWLIPKYGIVGAAWASILTDLIMLPIQVSIVWIGSGRKLPEVR